ncbi:MAG: hypothetical protein FWF77_07270, partial [Defluviitaleaceae bacterium]|nr:hypothetical protein [Defluviitaleaceae bacterium]
PPTTSPPTEEPPTATPPPNPTTPPLADPPSTSTPPSPDLPNTNNTPNSPNAPDPPPTISEAPALVASEYSYAIIEDTEVLPSAYEPGNTNEYATIYDTELPLASLEADPLAEANISTEVQSAGEMPQTGLPDNTFALLIGLIASLSTAATALFCICRTRKKNS